MTVEDKFNAFHAANPHVYELFKKFTYQLVKAGHRRLSSKLIVERIRWETAVTTTGAGFSPVTRKPFLIDNRYTAWYARKVIADFPKLAGFFETREIKTP